MTNSSPARPVAVLAGGGTNQSSQGATIVAPKAPSSWRRGDSNPRSENPVALKAAKPRSSSLNPLIYPSWWGDDVAEFKHAIMKRDRSHAPTGFQQHTTLENRIRQAREEPAFNVQQAYQRQTAAFNSNRGYTTTETGRNASSPSYAFTSNKNAPKYSPIRNMRPGANNIPMSYAGPPTQEEINRNRGRLHHANAYSQR